MDIITRCLCDINSDYLDGPLVLHNLTFDIRSGERIGIGKLGALEK